MDVMALLAEQKIAEAIRRGDFDNLPLKGQPIPHEDLSGVPEELRMGYKILKNAGMLPQELELNRERLRLQDLIACCDDEQERHDLRRRLTQVQLHFSILMEKNLRQPAWRQYGDRLRRRFGL